MRLICNKTGKEIAKGEQVFTVNGDKAKVMGIHENSGTVDIEILTGLGRYLGNRGHYLPCIIDAQWGP
jgi:hypothetical protein